MNFHRRVLSLFRSAFHFPSCHCKYEGFFPVVHLKYDMRQDSVIDKQIIGERAVDVRILAQYPVAFLIYFFVMSPISGESSSRPFKDRIARPSF